MNWKKLEQLAYQNFVVVLLCVTVVAVTFIAGCTAVALDDSASTISIKSKVKANPDGVNKHAAEKTQVNHRITVAQFEQVEIGMTWGQVLALLGEPVVNIEGDGQDVWKTVDNRLATVYYDNVSDDSEETPKVTGTEMTEPKDA